MYFREDLVALLQSMRNGNLYEGEFNGRHLQQPGIMSDRIKKWPKMRLKGNTRAVPVSLIAHRFARVMSLDIYVVVMPALPSPDPHYAALLSQFAAPDPIWSESTPHMFPNFHVSRRTPIRTTHSDPLCAGTPLVYHVGSSYCA